MASGGAAAPSPRRVCFFGTYNREYTVTLLLAQACGAAGFEVVECHRPLWEQTRDKLAGYFGAGSLLSLGKLLISFYVTCLVFILAVLWPIAHFTGVSLFRFIRYTAKSC